MKKEDIFASEGNEFQQCCMELARRVWATVVLGGQYTAHEQDVLHGLVQAVIDGGKSVDKSIYNLAVGLGMPEIQDVDEPGIMRLLSIHHIVSTIQCSVMLLALGRGTSNIEKDELSPEMAERKKISDMVRKLGRVCHIRGSQSDQDAHASATEILNGVCHYIEENKGELPEGFFDLMIPSKSKDLWTEEQRAKLSMFSKQLAQETRLRQRMMVDRALATLKAFSSSPLIRENHSLMRILDSYTEEAKGTMEMICTGKLADVDDAFRMTKGEIVSLLMETTFDNDQGQKKASKVKTIKIGSVPDRGGRPEGVSRAAALMPSWQKRKVQPRNDKGHYKNPKKKSVNNKEKNNASTSG